MKRVIIDANIVFAAIRSHDSPTRRKLLLSPHQFYSPNFLIGEIFKHKERIQQKAKASEDEILDFLNRILQRIHFFNESLISIENFMEAYHLCKDVDEKDVPYVALSLELSAELWTRDQALKDHLLSKGFTSFFDESGL